MKRAIVCTAIILTTLGLRATVAQAQNQQPSMPMGGMGEMHKPAPPAGPLEIKFGDKSATWTPATLAALPHTTVTVHNVHTKADETYSGVPIIALLTPLGVTDKPHGKDLRLYVVAAGSDGYEAVYAIGEVTPDVDEHSDCGRHGKWQAAGRRWAAKVDCNRGEAPGALGAQPRGDHGAVGAVKASGVCEPQLYTQ